MEVCVKIVDSCIFFVDSKPCPNNYTKFRESCYQVHKEPLTYHEALKECRKEREGEPGDLASLHNPHEQGEKTFFFTYIWSIFSFYTPWKHQGGCFYKNILKSFPNIWPDLLWLIVLKQNIIKNKPDQIKILFMISQIPLHKKWSFPLSIFFVNMTNSVNCGFRHVYWTNPSPIFDQYPRM